MDFKPTNESLIADFDYLLFETLGDDYLINNKINIVIVEGEHFEKFCDLDNSDSGSEEEAKELRDDFEYEEIDSVDYGDWDSLATLVGNEEAKTLRDSYFEADDFDDVISAVLLYYKNKFITIVSASYEI